MHDGAVDSDLEQDDLYTLYCDLYTTARDWTADAAALQLDDLLVSVTAIEHLDDLLDMDLIERYGPLVSDEPTVRSVIDRARDTLRERFSRRHLDEPALRHLGTDLRAAMTDMQKAIGGLESRIEDIDDLKHRIAMRKQIHAVTDLQKRVRRFAGTLSTLYDLTWESTFSAIRVQLTPKRDAVCQPVESAILDLSIPAAAALEARIDGESIVVAIDGPVHLSVAGHPGIPDLALSQIVIDKVDGVSLRGRDAEIRLTKKGTTTDVQVCTAG